MNKHTEALVWMTNANIRDINRKFCLIGNCIVGEPNPTEQCTVEYLKRIGYVGIWRRYDDKSAQIHSIEKKDADRAMALKE